MVIVVDFDFPNAATMERLFSPSTRYRDVLEREYHGPNLQELNMDVSTEEFLRAERAFTYADLSAILGNEDTLAWLTPHTAVVCGESGVAKCWEDVYEEESCCFHFSVDGKETVAMALSSEHLLEICDVVLRLLAVSVVHSVILDEYACPDEAFIKAPALAYLMEQCQSLTFLSLKYIQMDENHCRVLGDYSRPGLEIVLTGCDITSARASVLTEVLGRNQGPTKLDYCEIDNLIIANGLRGNRRLTSLRQRISSNIDVGNCEVLEIAGALNENRGLVDFSLRTSGFSVTEETRDVVCNSLKTHPTLEVLNLWSREASMAPAMLKSRIQALVDMMKVNISIHTLELDDFYYRHELFRGSVIPYLETNRFRPRLLAIQKTRPIPYRAKVLGRALLSARTDANRFWMLLSGNA
jgi:hypothetical protein